jgi:hypothetical protein
MVLTHPPAPSQNREGEKGAFLWIFFAKITQKIPLAVKTIHWRAFKRQNQYD